VLVGYAAGSQLAFSWFGADGPSASFVPAAGVTLSALLLTPRRRWWIVLLAATVAEVGVDLAHDIALVPALGYAVANTVQPAVGAGVVLALGWAGALGRRRDLGSFVVGGVVAGPAVGAVLGATTFVALGDGAGWGRFALEWWAGDGLGALVIGAAVLSLATRTAGSPSAERRLEAVAISLGCVIASALLFWNEWTPLAYVAIALLLALGFRAGTRAVAVTGAAVALTAAEATARGHEYWRSLDISAATGLVYLQGALGVLIVTGLAIAAEIREREIAASGRATAETARRESELAAQRAERLRQAAQAAEEALRESEARFRALFTSIDEGYCLCELIVDPLGRPVDYRFLEINPLFEEMTGLTGVVGRTAYEVVPDLEFEWVETYAEVALGGESARFELGSDAMGRHYDIFAMPIEPRGRFGLVFKDVTQRRRAEDALLAEQAAERRARHEAELRAEVVAALESAAGVRAKAQRLVEALVPGAADFVTIEIPGSQPLAAAHRESGMRRALEALREPERLGDEDAARLARAARGEEWLSGPEELPGAEEVAAGDVPGTAWLLPRSLAAVPLDVGGGVAGALCAGTDDPGRAPLGREDLSFLRSIAERCGPVLARAHVEQEEHRAAVSLQRALLPDRVVEHADLGIAARYDAASDALEVGGDWYDAFALPDGSIALAVGDVVGHGLEAAASMGRLRTALTALAPQTAGPAELLTLLHEFANGPNGPGFATACYATLDPATGLLRHASAGHPPILVVRADGGTTWLEDGRSAPLCAMEVAHRPQGSVVLEPGATVVMYSDGLIERRGEHLGEGLDRLERVAAREVGRPLDEFCDRLLAGAIAGAANNDDVVLLCVRLAPAEETAFRAVIPAHPVELAPLRARVREWMSARGIPERVAMDVLLGLGEACANAVEHAYRDGREGDVEVEVRRDGEGLLLRVRDFGTWRAPSARSDDRGRGTEIMRAVSSAFIRDLGERGTTVTMVVPVPADEGVERPAPPV
jgi:integral membrane sensor domain MASE1/anti-sigma regulatory factor (Ser/Thr protein kinase)